jgi:hypothetical protein
MGQKINPKIFRIGLGTNDWDSYYIEKNCEELTLLINNDIKIRECICRILSLNGLLLHSCKIRFIVESMAISIYYYRNLDSSFELDTKFLSKISSIIHHYFKSNDMNVYNSFSVSIRLRDLNKSIKNLVDLKNDYMNIFFRRYSKDALFLELLNVSLISMLVNNSSRLLVEFLVIKLQNIKYQNKVLFYLKLILSEFIKKDLVKVNGLKLIIRGRFNKSQRSRKKDIIFGSIPLQSLSSKIDYFQSTAFTSVGTFGVKLWICRRIK